MKTVKKINRDAKQQEEADKKFDSMRDELLKRDLSNTENYDKSILALSSATLGFSLAIIKFVVPIEKACYVFMLQSAWILLVISMLCSLFAYLISNKALDIQLNNARDYYKKGESDADKKKNYFKTLNTIINYSTGISFVIAISLIIAFVNINIENKEIKMTKETTQANNKGIIKKSANIPVIEPEQPSSSIPIIEESGSADSSSDNGDNSTE